MFSNRFSTVSRFLTGGRKPRAASIIEASEAELKLIEDSLEMSMVSRERMWALLNSVKYVLRNDLPGDFVECGVWRGGSSFLMASLLADATEAPRKVWLYDTFSGMVSPTKEDVRTSPEDVLFAGKSAAALMKMDATEKANSRIWGVASLDEVKQNMKRSGIEDARLEFIEGDVAKTLRQRKPERIAILRLDTDWYESTRAELEELAPRVVPGGVILVDDYGDWAGSRRAVDEYLDSLPHFPLVNRIDNTGRLWLSA